jgi:predicted ATP-grasp superfamily ATP-dependent carboligase
MKLISAPKKKNLTLVPGSHRVLALVADNQTGLAVVRSLGQRGLKVFSVCHRSWGRGHLVAHSRYCCGAWIVESDPKQPQFAEEIRMLACQLGVGSIMTSMECYHLSLIRNRHYFETDIHLFNPPAESFRKATDKDFMHGLCLQMGIPVARGTTLERFMTDRDGFSMKFPLVLRTKNLHLNNETARAPWKCDYAENEQQLQKLYAVVAKIASNVLVNEYHPGVEYFSQILMHRGQAFMDGEFVGEHHLPLAGGVTTRRVTCRCERIRNDTISLLQAIDWDGIAGVQFHYNPPTGEYIFLEVNPRFILSFSTVIRAGFDAAFLLWQSHFEPGKMKRTPYKLGLRTRSLGGEARWMLSMLRGELLPPGQKRLSKISATLCFLWHFGPWTKDEMFLWYDPKPSWARWKTRIRRFIRWSFHNISNIVHLKEYGRWFLRKIPLAQPQEIETE